MKKQLAIAQSQLILIKAAKEYEADWLKNVSTVVRDENGRFGKKEGNLIDKTKAAYQEEVKSHNKEVSTKYLADYINSIPGSMAQVTDYVFGGSYRAKMNDLAKGLGQLGDELRTAATRKYKEFEPKLASMKGEEFEQAVQDELIKLKLINERTLMEDLKEVKDAEGVKKVINKHQAEIIAGAVVVGRAATVVAGAFAPWFIGVAAGELLSVGLFGGVLPSVGVMLEQAMIAFGVSETAKGGANFLIDKKVKDKELNAQYKKWADLGTDVLGFMCGQHFSKMLQASLQASKNYKMWEKALEISAQVLKENTEALMKKEQVSLLSLGLKEYPATVAKLEEAYAAIAQKVAGKGLPLEKELTEINELKESLKFLKEQMKGLYD